ncbi:MAG: DUF192 domain-containing protein [Gammaproteobacteria bacterium]|nr:DUF192 domain-containing protein [Gammaproteobacteria bacterium]
MRPGYRTLHTLAAQRTAALCLLLCLTAFPSVQGASPLRLLSKFPATSIIVINSNGPCVLLDVWVATSPAQRSQGLMFIEELGVYEGMVFLYRQPADIAMWMKNTLISLDILFIRGNQRIASIAENTTPLSTDTIYSGEPVQIVLELNAGSTKRWNISPEDWILFNENPADLEQPPLF